MTFHSKPRAGLGLPAISMALLMVGGGDSGPVLIAKEKNKDKDRDKKKKKNRDQKSEKRQKNDRKTSDRNRKDNGNRKTSNNQKGASKNASWDWTDLKLELRLRQLRIPEWANADSGMKKRGSKSFATRSLY